jgi:hypothetical protein
VEANSAEKAGQAAPDEIVVGLSAAVESWMAEHRPQEQTREAQQAHHNRMSLRAAKSQARRLSSRELVQVGQLRVQETQIRSRELARTTVAAAYAEPPRFEYTEGPDGRRYITGGNAEIDTSPGTSAEQNMAKARAMRAAAMASGDAARQDQAVEAAASRLESEAREELARERAEAVEGRESARRERVADLQKEDEARRTRDREQLKMEQEAEDARRASEEARREQEASEEEVGSDMERRALSAILGGDEPLNLAPLSGESDADAYSASGMLTRAGAAALLSVAA